MIFIVSTLGLLFTMFHCPLYCLLPLSSLLPWVLSSPSQGASKILQFNQGTAVVRTLANIRLPFWKCDLDIKANPEHGLMVNDGGGRLTPEEHERWRGSVCTTCSLRGTTIYISSPRTSQPSCVGTLLGTAKIWPMGSCWSGRGLRSGKGLTRRRWLSSIGQWTGRIKLSTGNTFILSEPFWFSPYSL